MFFNNFLIEFLITLLLINTISWVFYWWIKNTRLKLVEEFFDEISGRYFHGFPLLYVFASDFFYRFAKYIGYGLCYESSALIMLLFKDIPSSKLVLADAALENGKISDHAFVELKFGGLTWCIDATWATPMAILWKPVYLLKFSIKKRRRVFSHEEFWEYPFSEPLREKIHSPETSKILYELHHYRSRRDGDKLRFFDLGDIEQEEWFREYLYKQMGECYFPTGTYAFNREKPVSDGVIRDFLERPERKWPTSKSLRRAKRIDREVKKYLSENKTTA